MTKTELVDAIAKSSKLTKTDSEKVLSAMIDTIIETLKKGDIVRLVGFGTFEPVRIAARKGRNPQTGKEIQIKSHKVPKFKAGKYLKEAVNTGK